MASLFQGAGSEGVQCNIIHILRATYNMENPDNGKRHMQS